MSHENLTTYLNDHLAGSVLALGMMDHLEDIHEEPELERLLTSLREEIGEEQELLERIMEQLGIEKSTVRRASAWTGEKFARLKLWVDDPSGGDLRLLEALEALKVGIEGKTSLWRSLAAAAEHSRALQLVDYAPLIERSLDQQERVEAERIRAARRALVLP